MKAQVDLNLVRAFAAVHLEGSFSAAAARLGVPRSTVSRAVAALEESLGVSLFQRTTRQVAITAAGAALYDRLAPSLESLEAALQELPDRAAAPSGTLRITSTADLGTMILAETIARFTHRYPGVRVEARLTNALVDLVKERFDLALRLLVRAPRDSGLVSRRVGAIALRLYASPSYIARRGAPRTPADLAEHDWVSFPGGSPLVLSGPGEEVSVSPEPRIVGDDMSFQRELLRAGAGIGPVPSFMADADVASGALVRVLPRWNAPRGAVFLAHPSRKHVPARVTAFRDLLVEMLRQRPVLRADEP